MPRPGMMGAGPGGMMGMMGNQMGMMGRPNLMQQQQQQLHLQEQQQQQQQQPMGMLAGIKKANAGRSMPVRALLRGSQKQLCTCVPLLPTGRT